MGPTRHQHRLPRQNPDAPRPPRRPRNRLLLHLLHRLQRPKRHRRTHPLRRTSLRTRHPTRHGNPRRSRTNGPQPTRLDRRQLREPTAALRRHHLDFREQAPSLSQGQLRTPPRPRLRLLGTEDRMTTTAEALLPPSPRPFRGIPRNHSAQNHPNRSHNAPTTAPKPPRTAPTPPPTNRGISTKPPTPLPPATHTCDSIHTYVRTD